MLISRICQMLFGAAALGACVLAARAAFSRDRRISLYVVLAGLFGLPLWRARS